MMDERKILIVNLSKGRTGEGNANLLGGMVITKIYLAAMSRADLTEGEQKLPNFYMYVDEFQSFANESLQIFYPGAQVQGLPSWWRISTSSRWTKKSQTQF